MNKMDISVGFNIDIFLKSQYISSFGIFSMTTGFLLSFLIKWTIRKRLSPDFKKILESYHLRPELSPWIAIFICLILGLPGSYIRSIVPSFITLPLWIAVFTILLPLVVGIIHINESKQLRNLKLPDFYLNAYDMAGTLWLLFLIVGLLLCLSASLVS